MNGERYLETLLFGKPDRVPLSSGGPRKSTLRAWHQQGLLEGVPWQEQLRDALGIPQGPASALRAPDGLYRRH